ncbi:MAG: ribosomal protein S18-alanine N-acetyltransferase [Quinella sp. 2Q5]|nr:ribosomal protein S18-alanine N-acetyltransferase [Quinella sp. 2Q5]
MGETARLVFRPMTTDDADKLAALDAQCFKQADAWNSGDFFSAAMDANFAFVVGERGGEIVACAGAEISADQAEVETVAVAPEFRGRGVGKKLLAELLDVLTGRGVTFVVLEVRPSNAAAVKLYDSFDFQIVERAENFYGDEDAWIMVREF